MLWTVAGTVSLTGTLKPSYSPSNIKPDKQDVFILDIIFYILLNMIKDFVGENMMKGGNMIYNDLCGTWVGGISFFCGKYIYTPCTDQKNIFGKK